MKISNWLFISFKSIEYIFWEHEISARARVRRNWEKKMIYILFRWEMKMKFPKFHSLSLLLCRCCCVKRENRQKFSFFFARWKRLRLFRTGVGCHGNFAIIPRSEVLDEIWNWFLSFFFSLSCWPFFFYIIHHLCAFVVREDADNKASRKWNEMKWMTFWGYMFDLLVILLRVLISCSFENFERRSNNKYIKWIKLKGIWLMNQLWTSNIENCYTDHWQASIR